MSTSPSTLLDHRISRAVEILTARRNALSPANRARFDEAATMSSSDLLAFGDMPSRGLLAGRLTADEAQALHAIHASWETSTPAERAVFLTTMGELVRGGV